MHDDESTILDTIRTNATNGTPTRCSLPDGTPAPIRATALGRLLRENSPAWQCVDVASLQVIGRLELDDLRLDCPLRLGNCRIDDGISLERSKLRDLVLRWCRIGGLAMSQAAVEHGFRVEDCTSVGRLAVVGTSTGGPLELVRVTIHGVNGPAIEGDYVSPGQGMTIDDCKLAGSVDLGGARITGQLVITGGTIEPSGDTAVRLAGADLTKSLQIRGLGGHGAIDLIGATTHSVLVDDLTDESLGVWEHHPPRLTAFRYVGFMSRSTSPGSWDVDRRLAWLRMDRPFRPGPYRQLATVFEAAGLEDGCRRIRIAEQQDRTTSGDLTTPRRLWHRFLGLTIQHGYSPARPVIAGVVIVLLLSALVWATSDDFVDGDGKPAGARLVPVVYAVDTFVPIVDFGQFDAFTPTGSIWLRSGVWLTIALGWLITTLFVAAVTNLVKRD